MLLRLKVGVPGSSIFCLVLFSLPLPPLNLTHIQRDTKPPPLLFSSYSRKYYGYSFLDAAIESFCEMLEDFCGRAEVPTDDLNDSELLSLPVADVRKVVNEILSLRTKKLLHLVSVDILVRLLRVLDHQIHRAEGLSVYEHEHVSCTVMISPLLLWCVYFNFFQDSLSSITCSH